MTADELIKHAEGLMAGAQDPPEDVTAPPQEPDPEVTIPPVEAQEEPPVAAEASLDWENPDDPEQERQDALELKMGEPSDEFQGAETHDPVETAELNYEEIEPTQRDEFEELRDERPETPDLKSEEFDPQSEDSLQLETSETPRDGRLNRQDGSPRGERVEMTSRPAAQDQAPDLTQQIDEMLQGQFDSLGETVRSHLGAAMERNAITFDALGME